MRAVLIEVPEYLIEERRRKDVDRYDEMWEGELHMSPLPSWIHQRLEVNLSYFFKAHWENMDLGTICPHVGVKPPGTPDVDLAGQTVPRNYRGPDMVFLLEGHEDRVQDGWVVGPPDSLIEIRSPGDETYEKFPFYFDLGVTEVIVIHRDTKATEIYARGLDVFERVPVETDGSVRSRVLDTTFRTVVDPTTGASVLHLHRTSLPDRQGTA